MRGASLYGPPPVRGVAGQQGLMAALMRARRDSLPQQSDTLRLKRETDPMMGAMLASQGPHTSPYVARGRAKLDTLDALRSLVQPAGGPAPVDAVLPVQTAQANTDNADIEAEVARRQRFAALGGRKTP